MVGADQATQRTPSALSAQYRKALSAANSTIEMSTPASSGFAACAQVLARRSR